MNKIKVSDIYTKLIILFPLTTLFQNYVSFLNIALLIIVVFFMGL